MNQERIILEKDDIAEYQGEEYSVTKVWNHGYHVWYDLKALKPMYPSLTYFPEPLSCPEGEVKFLRKEKTNNMKIEIKQNFISVDGKTARSSYGEFFTVNEVVKHQEESAGEATILSFEADVEKNEVKVITNMGSAHLDFLVKTGSNTAH